ncbi:spore germination protein [Bacillus sp. V5-8f]|uniref:spore germination protein n=1 Tax=Bacillus sp. V5-8f TaxID=2053044 RepID=UPI000C77ABB5|nr:spore germination protein [Bacillus sp. V5-8f]PLT32901.1 spore germination protein [Bacillus sp. V5-8f]
MVGVFKRKNKKLTSEEKEPNIIPTLAAIREEFRDCADLVENDITHLSLQYTYIENLVKEAKVQELLVEPFDKGKPDDVIKILSETRYQEVADNETLCQGVLDGKAAIFYKEKAYLVNVFGPEARSIAESQTESVIIGPHDSFVESAGNNLSLIRRRIKSSSLKTLKFRVGNVCNTDVYIVYIEGIANPEFVSLTKKRILAIGRDGIIDSAMLVQMIDDQPYSVFPQFLTTERPDSTASKLLEGKIVIMADGSPSVIIAPTSFFEFFNTSEDYYQRWAVATFLRILRYTAFFITIFFTAFYVAVTTFHYEMIPRPLLMTLLKSRMRVPFPPLYEALLMEVTVELLREAGARLPTKIGQTIGIVGGIVIGESAVQAGLTSNILIISTAISAIASFVIPSYMMSQSIRLVRFGIILLAGIWGNFGIMIGLGFVLIHLASLTSLKTSYMTPITPMAFGDLKDILIRAPFSKLRTRPSQSRTDHSIRRKNGE